MWVNLYSQAALVQLWCFILNTHTPSMYTLLNIGASFSIVGRNKEFKDFLSLNVCVCVCPVLCVKWKHTGVTSAQL